MKNSLKTRGFIAGIALIVAAFAILFSVASVQKANVTSNEAATSRKLIETIQKNTVDGLQVIGKKVGSAVPVTPSVFETSLAASIGTSDTTLTLASGTLRDSTTISGYYCFTIDESTPTLEYVCGTAAGTAVTGLVRGIDPLTGTTTTTSLTYAHRRGADVKVSDYPVLGILARIAAGVDTFAQPVRYDSSISTTTIALDRSNLATAGLVADTAFAGAGVINASSAAKGIVQLATGAQLAAGVTVGSSGANLIAAAASATSTFVSGASNKLVVTDSNNRIDSNFISTSTLSAPPVGTIVSYGANSTSTVPTGYLYTDGSAVSRATYADLFNRIGTSYGIGDGSTTFNIPFLPRSVDNGSRKFAVFDQSARSALTSSGTSLSFNATTAGTNRLLVVNVTTTGTNPTATYNGVSMTRVSTQLNAAGSTVAQFYLANPTIGTNSVAVSWTGSAAAKAQALSFSGLNQTSPLDTWKIGTATSTIATTTSNDNDLMVLAADETNMALPGVFGSAGWERIGDITNSNTSIASFYFNHLAPSGLNGGSFTGSAGTFAYVLGAYKIVDNLLASSTPYLMIKY